MLEFKFSGKTINQAIQSGIDKLGIEKQNVEIKVLTPPQNFRDAVVLICVPKVYATAEICELYELERLDSEIAKQQKAVQKHKKEKTSILKKLLTEVAYTPAENNNLSAFETAKKKFEYIIKLCGVNDAVIDAREDNDYIYLSCTHPALDEVVGKNGKTLLKVQQTLNQGLKSLGKKIVVDINGFKHQQTQKTIELTQKTIQKVLETGESISLKPMNAYLRRVVHNLVAENKGVASESSGTPPKRFVTISKSE